MGKYALITGATSGIGLCYAREMARRGYHILVVSNQQDRLPEIAHGLSNEYGVKALGIYADLSLPTSAKELFDRCSSEGIEVEVLICNAGMLLFSTFANTPPERLRTIGDLHCTTTTLLCRYFGEQMKERGHGRILIMSSATAWLPYPTISHYSATKAYLKNFAFALWYEMYRYGVSVTAIFPGAVDTPLYNLGERPRKWLRALGVMQSAEAIAKRGTRAMLRGRRRVIPGLFTKLVVAICSILPARILELIIRIPPIRRLLERI